MGSVIERSVFGQSGRSVFEMFALNLLVRKKEEKHLTVVEKKVICRENKARPFYIYEFFIANFAFFYVYASKPFFPAFFKNKIINWSSFVKTSENQTFGFGPVEQPNVQNPN